MSTTEATIRSALGSVKDPATGHGIVASGQLTSVKLADDGAATLSINLISPGR